MNFIKTPIEGVIIVEPRVFNDPRGYFFESYNAKEFKANGIDCDFVQDNHSVHTFASKTSQTGIDAQFQA